MTIASEITRLQGAKEDIRQAIIDKGVSVSADLTIDEYACCIAEIQTLPQCGYVDVLVVGGGGGSGGQYYNLCGVGGAGGFIQCCGYVLSPETDTTVSITVGCGGAVSSSATAKGGASTFKTICALGGGGGNCTNKNGASGAGSYGDQIYTSQSWGPGSGTSGQGYKGGNYISNCWFGCARAGGGGGGGGAGGAGGDPRCLCSEGNSAIFKGGNGGIGKQSDYDGTLRYYAGGPGGSIRGGNCCGYYIYGCTGDHGCGYDYCGGGGYQNSAGKSGIVIVRYKTDGSCGIKPTSTGGTKYTCGEYTIHKFTNVGSDSFLPVFK